MIKRERERERKRGTEREWERGDIKTNGKSYRKEKQTKKER